MAIIDFDSECWGDPWFQMLKRLERYLFLYSWTNNHQNPAGLYVITKKTMSDETDLSPKEIDSLLKELHPKVQYDPEHSVCWVVKFVRRQYLRGEKISPKQRAGVRRYALKLKRHPFFLDFARAYPEIFSEEELDTLSKGMDTFSKGIDTLQGQGQGKGKGNSFKKEERVQGEKEKLFEEFWELYPARSGKKLSKEEAKEYFLKKIKDEEVGALLQAVRNYNISKAVTEGYARDAIRFLKKDFWRSWVEQSAPTSQTGFKGAKLWLETKERQDEKRRQRAICDSDGKTQSYLPDQPHT